MLPLKDINLLQYDGKYTTPKENSINVSKSALYLLTRDKNLTILSMQLYEKMNLHLPLFLHNQTCTVSMITIDLLADKKISYSVYLMSTNKTRLIQSAYEKHYKVSMLLCLWYEDQIVIKADNAPKSTKFVNSNQTLPTLITENINGSGQANGDVITSSVKNIQTNNLRNNSTVNIDKINSTMSILQLNYRSYTEGFSAYLSEDVVVITETSNRIEGWKIEHPYWSSTFGFKEGKGMYIAAANGYYYVTIRMKVQDVPKNRCVRLNVLKST